MKVTLLISSLSCGGAERVVCNLANYLVSKKHEVDILTVSDKITYKPDVGVNIVCMYAESKSRLPHFMINILRIYNFNKYLRKKKPDVYVTFLPELTISLMIQKRFFKSPVIIAERSDPKEFCSRSKGNKRRWKRYYPNAEGYVFQTEDAKKFYNESGINIKNNVVIPNAINHNFIREKYEGERDKTIVSAGRFTEQKNFDLLIRAFANVSNKFPEYNLIIYGQGPLKKGCEKLSSDIGIIDKVRFPGYVDDLDERVQRASLFVSSSNYEGMSNALAEAMALGVPCIATDCPVGGSRYLINSGVNGLLVPVNHLEEMTNAIYMLLKDEERAKGLAKDARKISDFLSAERIYSKWEKHITNISEKY